MKKLLLAVALFMSLESFSQMITDSTKTVTIYNMSGKLVSSYEPGNEFITSFVPESIPQYYVMQFISYGGEIKSKIVLL